MQLKINFDLSFFDIAGQTHTAVSMIANISVPIESFLYSNILNIVDDLANFGDMWDFIYLDAST